MNKLLLSAAFALCLQAIAPAASAQGQAQNQAQMPVGEAKAAMCIGCHGIPGYQASFPEVHKVPMISGQTAKYLESALGAYRKGDRKHPTMVAIAQSLTDQDITALAGYYANHGEPKTAPAEVKQPSPEVAALLKKANCASCHGANFSKPIDPTYPKIAGQHADYLYVSLKAYRLSGNAKIGRNNPIMAGMAKLYTLPELKQLSDYLGSVEGELQTVPQSRFR